MQFWLPDVSYYQGKPDWEKLKNKANIPAAIVRIGWGDDDKTQDDIYASYNLSECLRLGIPVAAYLYSYADSDAHIKSEIKHMQRMTAGRMIRAHILDIEEWKNRKFVKRACELWLEAFPDTGIVYAGMAYWKDATQGPAVQSLGACIRDQQRKAAERIRAADRESRLAVYKPLPPSGHFRECRHVRMARIPVCWTGSDRDHAGLPGRHEEGSRSADHETLLHP